MPITLHNPEERPAAEGASRRIVDAANALEHVSDSKGRSLGWRKLDALEEFDLSELAGANNVGTAQWMMFAMIAFSVREIDGQAMPRPGTKNDLRARVKLLGAEGLNAIVQRLQGQAEQADDLGVDLVREESQGEMERAKNSPGTPR